MAYGIFSDLTKEEILKRVDSYTIFRYYCIGFRNINEKFHSPLRNDDTIPSASITYYNGDLLFKDFGEPRSYRAIDFVSRLFNLSYHETLEKINNDLILNITKPNIIEPISYNKEKKTTIIKVKYRDWNLLDIEYWNQFHISIDTLIKFNVFPISYFSINDYIYKAEDLSYSYNYYWEDDIFRRKIYQPLSIIDKWFSNGGAIVQGEGMLPKYGELLIITSSLKDVMALYEMGYTAIAPVSEMSFVPKFYFEKQNTRYDKILVFMNSDEAGMKRNIELSKEWEINYIFIPMEYNSKDPSDLIKNIGFDNAKKIIDNEISSKI